MRRIFVPINHEVASFPAVVSAARICVAYDATIDLVYVKQTPAHAVEADELLYEARKLLETRGMEACIVRLEGRAGTEIARLAIVADLIVCRNQPRDDLDGEGPGAVGQTIAEIVRQTPCPVLVVSEQVTAMSSPLFAYNGSPQSRRAMHSALHILAPGIVERGVVLIVTPDQEMAERLFAEVAEMAQTRSVELTLRWAAGRPGEVILEQLKSGGHDLLVMGAYGRNWLRQRLFGSTTNRVFRSCPVPVWIAR